MFLPGSDLRPIENDFEKVLEGLTRWEPKNRTKGVIEPGENVRIEGRDYQEAVANMNNLFLRNRWGDGLPLVPATEERIRWLLRGTDLSPDAVVGEGKVLPRGGIATVKQIAINLAMAGGRPEYLAVLIAAVEAMLKPEFRHQHWQPTTANTYPVIIVNGPVAKQIRLNSGYGALGPDPARPAGAALGRAIRLLLMNLGGAIPGKGTMSIHGGANRYTNIVFAEDEAGLPSGWMPLHVERGHAPGSNVVTLHVVEGTVNIHADSVTGSKPATPREVSSAALGRLAGFIRVPCTRYWDHGRQPEYAVGIVLLGRGTARLLASLGYTKEKVQSFLWENTAIPWTIVQSMGTRAEIEGWIERSQGTLVEGQPWSITVNPRNIMIVVAGGEASTHMYWMQGGNGPQKVVDAEVKLPGKMNLLVTEAERDLGPAPVG